MSQVKWQKFFALQGESDTYSKFPLSIASPVPSMPILDIHIASREAIGRDSSREGKC